MFEDYQQPLDPTTNAIDNVIRTLVGRVSGVARGEADTMHESLPSLPETVPEDVRDVRRLVAQQLEGYHGMLRDELRRGVVGPHMGAQRGTDLLEVMLSKAGYERDGETVETCVETLGQLARPGRSELADASWAGQLYIKAVVSGSARAMKDLHVRLRTEQEYQVDLEGQGTYAPYGTYLLGAVSELTKHGLPAQELIDKYAVNPTRKFAYYMAYLKACREQYTDSADVKKLEEQVAEQYHELPRRNTSDSRLIAQLLLQLRSEQLRWSVYETFRASCQYLNGHVLLGPAAYSEIFDALLLIPPSELNDDHREELEGLAEAGREVIAGSRFEMWKIDAAVAEGSTPQAVIAYAQTLIGNDQRRENEAGQTQLVKEVDEVMAKYAVRYAAAGEFDAASTFLEAISDPYRTEEALDECAKRTQTAHQRSQLQPGGVKTMLYPGLTVYAELSGLLASQGQADTSRLVALTEQFAVDPDMLFGVSGYGSDSAAEAQHERAAEICDLALRRLDPPTASKLARSIKDELEAVVRIRDVNEQYRQRAEKIARRLSDLLVRLGEAAETRTRYEKLHTHRTSSPDSPDRWAVCMDLADLLFDRRLVLKQ